MSEIWFTSDTHFFHSNMLKFETGRNRTGAKFPFRDCKEMDMFMFRNWNEKVAVSDKIYHLGDVTFRYDGLFNELMSQLHGQKRLIIGNHDRLKNPNLLRWFEKADLWTGGKFKHLNFCGSHVPLREDQMRKGEFNLHGHVHWNSLSSRRHINLCVEVTDYQPVHVETILSWMKERS